MEPFKKHTGTVAILDASNVDTDQIIAKQFLKSIRRTGFGEHLFYDWRHEASGKLNPDFSLNDPAFRGASILVARNNFGCGSSREHAVWAIKQYGFNVVIACSKRNGDQTIPAFADIFQSNAIKNSLLTIELSEKEVEQIFQTVRAHKGVKATADLEHQTLTLHSAPPLSFSFKIDPSAKRRMIEGLDDIGLTLQHQSAIDTFEKRHRSQIYKS